MQKQENILKKIYPKPPEANYNNLKYDIEGLWSITHPEEADIISLNIVKLLEIYNLPDESIIDMTAGCGGNTLSFCKYFKKVIAVENNIDRYDILLNNLSCYNYTNYVLIQSDSIECINDTYDIFFIDPPWGGPDYKKIINLELYMSGVKLFDIINMIPYNKLIVLKLPFNYNTDELIQIFKLLLKLEIKNIIILYLLKINK